PCAGPSTSRGSGSARSATSSPPWPANSVKAPRSTAARRAIALYDTAPRGDRFHVRARWWSAPLVDVERAAPVHGRILEIGCGHGLLSLYLALSAPGRHVTGVDI